MADATGNSPESLAGTVSLEDFRFGGDKGNAIKVDRFRAALTSHEGEKNLQSTRILYLQELSGV